MLKMIELPYPLNALEPYYSKETLDLHYNVLYKGYVDNTNKTEEKLEQARKNNDFSDIKCLEKDLSFFGSGAISSKVIEASGWNLLVWVPDFKKIEILQCEKHQNLTLWGCKPLLVMDMWEHSYFLQYKTKRLDYINAFWNIVNWNEVNKRFC